MSQRTAAPGDGKKLSVKTAKRGSKTVTVLTPLAAMPMEPKKMLKKLKERLGTGGTVAGDAVEVQGDHQAAVNDFILSINRGGFALPASSASAAAAASFPAYLELTDAYGVVFNANYLLLYTRLLPAPNALRKVRDMNFSSSARLGGEGYYEDRTPTS